MGCPLPSSGRRRGSSLDLDPSRSLSRWFLGRYTAPHWRSPRGAWAMHPPTRRISRPPLQHPQPEIPPIEPISAESLAYPLKPLFPNSRRTSQAALPHRNSIWPATSVHPLQRLNRAGSRPRRVIMPTFRPPRRLASQHAPYRALVSISACYGPAALACQLVSFVRSVPRRVVRAHPSEFLLRLGRGIPLG